MRIDAETGGRLLEEAERDLLDPLILNAAGLDTHEFLRGQSADRPSISARRESAEQVVVLVDAIIAGRQQLFAIED